MPPCSDLFTFFRFCEIFKNIAFTKHHQKSVSGASQEATCLKPAFSFLTFIDRDSKESDYILRLNNL